MAVKYKQKKKKQFEKYYFFTVQPEVMSFKNSAYFVNIKSYYQALTDLSILLNNFFKYLK